MTKNILIIDDSIDIQELLKLLFESRGHQITCASNGDLARDYLSQCKDLPDLILLDLQMPSPIHKSSGTELLIRNQEDIRLKHIPTFLMSGAEDIYAVARRFNVKQVFPKPLDIFALVTAVETQGTTAR